jgi:hypothetical protein
MRKYDYQSMDRSLIDLRDRRDQLSIEINLLKDKDQPDLDAVSRMRLELEFLDSRIDTHTKAPRH